MPERSEQFRKRESNYRPRHPYLENLKCSGILQKGTLKNEKLDEAQTFKMPKFPRIKIIDVTYSVSGEWSNMGIEDGFNEKVLTKLFEGFPQLRVLKLRAIKTMSNYEDIMNMLTAISNLQNIHQLEFEYLNCRISDMEVIAFAQGLMKIKQLKSFRLKVIQ